MENTIEYVLYERVKDNEYINTIKPLDEAIKKIKRTKNGVVMEEFYVFTQYKNVRTLSELSSALKDDEHLVIDLTQIKKADAKRSSDKKLYDKIKETIDASFIIPYVSHGLEKTQPIKREVGEKLHLIAFEDMSKNRTNFKDYLLVQVKMHEDQTCDWENITFTAKHKKELIDDLRYQFGGYSGLYCLIPEDVALEQESYYEITKIEDGKWDFVRVNKTKNK